MTWNWQRKNWPEFTYCKDLFYKHEKQFLLKAGSADGALKHLDEKEAEELTVDIISEEALKTSEIEGEQLNIESIRSSVRKHFGLQKDKQRPGPQEDGISEMMVHLHNTWDEQLTHDMLFHWNLMVARGRRDLTDVGQYRTHDDSMQVVSSRSGSSRVYFEAPSSICVPDEMSMFIDWFNASRNSDSMSGLSMLRAGIAHIYFESIHPFEDGNGRIGRALSEKALFQCLNRPALIGLSYAIEQKRSDYYAALNRNSYDLNVDDWLKYFCGTVLEALEISWKRIEFLIEKGKFYQKFSAILNERQMKVVVRIFREGIDGFKGGLSADNYISITGTSRATATRDLQDLLDKRVLTKTGKRRYTRYFLDLEFRGQKNKAHTV